MRVCEGRERRGEGTGVGDGGGGGGGRGILFFISRVCRRVVCSCASQCYLPIPEVFGLLCLTR